MNHDYAHCADWSMDCPKQCFRGQLTEDLRKGHFYRPVSFMHFDGTEECEKSRTASDSGGKRNVDKDS